MKNLNIFNKFTGSA